MGLLDQFLVQHVDPHKRRLRGLLTDPAATLEQTAYNAVEQRLPSFADVVDAQSVMPQVAVPPMQRFMDLGVSAGMNLGGIVKPSVARSLNTATKLPNDDLFSAAVSNTPGASVVDDGLLMRVQRNQLPEQAQRESVRGGVFYLPEGAPQARFYTHGRGTNEGKLYGGSERIAGETLVRNPVFVKGATGGKAPEAAYDQIKGKGAYEAMRKDALDVNWGRSAAPGKGGPTPDEFLDRYAPEMSGLGDYILKNSKKGNQLAYALQEAAVSSAVRKAGHDAVIGYSKKRGGQPFISELFDVRESHYPDRFGWSRLFPDFLDQQP